MIDCLTPDQMQHFLQILSTESWQIVFDEVTRKVQHIVVFAEEGNVYWEYTQSGLSNLWCTKP